MLSFFFFCLLITFINYGNVCAYFLSGYLCPTCPSATNPSSLIANINSAYNHINIAFLGFKSDGSVINEFDAPSKNFELNKQMISNLKSKGVMTFISIGGGAGNVLSCSAPSSFTSRLSAGILNITNKYGFDGVDFDIEHRSGDYVECANIIASVMNTLHSTGLKVTMAPQMTNVYPDLSTVSAGFNELAPLVAMEPSSTLQWIQVQMYNTWSSVETIAYAETYTKEVSAGYICSADGKNYNVQIPPSQLVLGYPASTKGAGSGYINPSQLKSMYSSLKEQGYTIAGFMTWSIGWDQQNNWNFANTLKNL